MSQREDTYVFVVFIVGLLALSYVLSGCELAPSSVSRTLPVDCVTSVAPSGADDRVAIQLALDTCKEVHLDGDYYIATPSTHPRGMLELRGRLVCTASTRLLYSGDTSGADWFGIWIRGSDSLVSGCTIDSTGLFNTREQTHAIAADGRSGPLHNIEIAYVRIIHPAGDGVDLVGYEPTATSPDQRLFNVRVHHTTFERAGRSGITFFGGCNSCEFDHNTAVDVSDQQYDGEGKGGGSHGVKIHHNYGRVGPHSQSGLALQIQGSSDVDVYSNDWDQGIYSGGCRNCSFHDFTIDQAVPLQFAVLHLAKTGDVRVWNVHLTRQASAGVNGVFVSVWALNAPARVDVSDSSFVQYANTHVVGGIGTELLTFDNVDVDYRGTPGLRLFGIAVEGGPIATGGKRAALSVSNTRVIGQLLGSVFVSGSQAGVGEISITRTQSTAGLLCQNTNNVTGPLVYENNIMPAKNCVGVP